MANIKFFISMYMIKIKCRRVIFISAFVTPFIHFNFVNKIFSYFLVSLCSMFFCRASTSTFNCAIKLPRSNRLKKGFTSYTIFHI